MEKQNVSTRMPGWMIEKIDQKAQKEDISRGAYIRKVLKTFWEVTES